MPEKNKDLYKNPKEKVKEKIDKKEIDKELDILESKIKENLERSIIMYEILDLSLKLGSEYDIKVTIKPNTKDLLLTINGTLLNIPLNYKAKAERIFSAIKKGLESKVDNSKIGKIKELTGLGDNKIYLTGDNTGRTVKINNSVLSSDMVIFNTLHNSKGEKNEVEEVFVFLMQLKGIKKEDWDIESTVCRKNKITDECKNELGLPSISPENF